MVGINLLREGLDLPEVSLVAILDADKEGFLRSETSLIQTIGRAARNVEGKVIMYADEITNSMNRAISETNRRRQIQIEYNKRYGITPKTINKGIRDIIEATTVAEDDVQYRTKHRKGKVNKKDLEKIISALEDEMKDCARNLQFERAAELRDRIAELQDAL